MIEGSRKAAEQNTFGTSLAVGGFSLLQVVEGARKKTWAVDRTNGNRKKKRKKR